MIQPNPTATEADANNTPRERKNATLPRRLIRIQQF
jgi:hypothetical protein